MRIRRLIALIVLGGSCGALQATETENLGIRVLPSAGKMVIDGKADDWDLSGGVFACGEVENLRDSFAVWIHASYDADSLYLLARFRDATPLNNPGQTAADYGFAGDCLQTRIVTAPGTPQERGNHITAWKGRDGEDVINIERGTTFKEGVLPDAKKEGAKQAFSVDADGKGYVQEIALPWTLLTRDEKALKSGEKFTLTIEPNFTIGTKGRLTIKDIFKPGVTVDRVFTFMSPPCWGTATLEATGKVAPAPVRLADARDFPVRMEDGVPVVDWNGLIKGEELLGFKSIALDVPEDGYVSLNLANSEGVVVRQLLNARFLGKGKHEVKWDGLTTPSWNKPGEPVPPGSYRWEAIHHKGIGLRLRGWAVNGGGAPWDGPSGKDNWGGDHGLANSCATGDGQVYLGWGCAEAGKAVLACDLEGHVLWGNTRAGIAGVKGLATDGGVVYVLGGAAGVANEGGSLYKLDAKTGSYLTWGDGNQADLIVKDLWADAKGKPERADAIDVKDGVVYLGFTKDNTLLLVDAKSGTLKRAILGGVPSPGAIKVLSDRRILILSGGKTILDFDPDTGRSKPMVEGLDGARAFAVDAKGKMFVGVGEPLQQVLVFDAEGKRTGAIGREGGRAKLGPWQADGLRSIAGLAVDAEGKIWAAEDDDSPKRVSVWDAAKGAFVREFFGPTSYGALGGAINPLDPDVMVGQGCEWRLDPKTGIATCVGTIHRGGMSNSRFGVGANGKLYLAVAENWAFENGPLHIYERVGDADYRPRTAIFPVDADGREPLAATNSAAAKATRTAIWSDENGDGKRQPEEIKFVEGVVRLSGWYMGMTQDLAFTLNGARYPVAGFTACGAPKYDLSKPEVLPKPEFEPVCALSSVDGKFLLCDGPYGADHGQFACFDLAGGKGKLKWTYPDNFIGVHGSHNAVPPATGMIRGSYGSCGTAKLPDPVGNAWFVATNVGEWHILTERGFYLTRLFQPDPLKVVWPERAVPGALMDNTPPGMGGEDFGGSISQGQDGKVYIQSGKTAFWNLEVVGLNAITSLPGGSMDIKDGDLAEARKYRESSLQAGVGKRRLAIPKHTPTLTGDVAKDFAGSEVASFKKLDEAAVRFAASWDDKNLYLGWDVEDSTPWVNGAEASEFLYLGGDTVDFQLGTDTAAEQGRDRAVQGDLRLSIGNFKDKPTAVVYRPVSGEKNPRVFSSGVVKEYHVDSVRVLDEAKVEVTKRTRGYVVEATISLTALGLKPAAGLGLRGDIGATHGDPAGRRTRLRTHWSNQHTGIVDDAVFELMPEPSLWGEIIFRE